MKHLFSNAPFRHLGGPVAVKALHAGVHLLLAGMFIAICVSLWISLWQQHPLKPPGDKAAPPVPLRATAPIEKITSAHLFGQVSPGVARNAAPPPADILLAGIVFGTDAAHSRAILSVDGRAVVAAVGNTVSGDIRIADIKPDYIQIE
ncbi:MAG TPA: type II secretion system protein N [Gammaproteobacteria bacterium]|nr:type II secretion system protein N [Gammaproteobacteria bacterium]